VILRSSGVCEKPPRSKRSEKPTDGKRPVCNHQKKRKEDDGDVNLTPSRFVEDLFTLTFRYDHRCRDRYHIWK
jgi:hypothetical protein